MRASPGELWPDLHWQQPVSFIGRLTCDDIVTSLPNNTVVDVDTVDLFKSGLDKFRMHLEVKYAYTAEFTGTEKRSVYYN